MVECGTWLHSLHIAPPYDCLLFSLTKSLAKSKKGFAIKLHCHFPLRCLHRSKGIKAYVHI